MPKKKKFIMSADLKESLGLSQDSNKWSDKEIVIYLESDHLTLPEFAAMREFRDESNAEMQAHAAEVNKELDRLQKEGKGYGWEISYDPIWLPSVKWMLKYIEMTDKEQIKKLRDFYEIETQEGRIDLEELEDDLLTVDAKPAAKRDA